MSSSMLMAADDAGCQQRANAWVNERNAALLRSDPTLRPPMCARSVEAVPALRRKLDELGLACSEAKATNGAPMAQVLAKYANGLTTVKLCSALGAAATASGPAATASAPAATAKSRATAASAIAIPSAASAAAPARVRQASLGSGRVSIGAPPPDLANARLAARDLTTAARPLPQAECLAVQRLGGTAYRVDNLNCRSHTVLAAIELHLRDNSIRCYVARIVDTLPVGGESMGVPRVNYQCRLGADGCVERAVTEMFPECRAPTG